MKNSNEPKTQLLNSFTAPTEFYNEVYQNMRTRVVAMLPGVVYTAKEIALEYWDSLPTDRWKRLAGRCFAHMVSTHQFPVKFANKKSCTKHYKTK